MEEREKIDVLERTLQRYRFVLTTLTITVLFLSITVFNILLKMNKLIYLMDKFIQIVPQMCSVL